MSDDDVLGEILGENGPPRPPANTPQLGINFERGEATFDARPGEPMTAALERLIREMWHDVDQPTLDILDVAEVTFWGNPEQPMKRFRAKIRQLSADALTTEAMRTVLDRAAKRKPRRPPKPIDAERTLVVALADLQIGKAHERFGGTPETIERVANWRGMIEDLSRDLRKIGQPVSRVFLLGMGDTTEGCGSNPNYQGQDFKVDCHETDQQEIAADIHERFIDELARWAPEVWSSVMASNHTENNRKKSGKSKGPATGDRSDSRDFMLWRDLARTYRKNLERYGHVNVWVPRETPNEVCVDLHGVGLVGIHGDITPSGVTPADKMFKWWRGQKSGDHPSQPLHGGRCSIVVAGHYHHHWALMQNGATFLGCPSGDGGSGYLTDATGLWSPPGLLTFTVDAWGPDHIRILPDPSLT